jgi:pilus assembly protein CpaC
VAARTTGRQVVLSGNASTGELKRLNLAIRAYPGVVNLVRPDTVAMKRMVVLDVQVVDFSKNALDNLGINWQTSIVGPAVGLVGDFVNNSLYRLGDVTQGGQAGNALNGPQGGLSGLPLNVPPFSSYAGIVSSITAQINLAVQNGRAYILANPRLVTRSGGTATFLAGGEVPIPVSAGFGAVSVTYKNYGVKLKIQPDVDHQGNILATVNTAISQINPALTVQGYPAFLTRKTDSVVNVHSGQTIVLSGLILQRRQQHQQAALARGHPHPRYPVQGYPVPAQPERTGDLRHARGDQSQLAGEPRHDPPGAAGHHALQPRLPARVFCTGHRARSQ